MALDANHSRPRIEPDCTDAENDAFGRRVDRPLVFGSSAYHRFLARIMPGTEIRRLCARQGDEIVGILPYVIASDQHFGAALNSLPFFGSHGGPFADASLPDGGREVRATLTEALVSRIANAGISSATVVEHPLQPLDAEQLARLNLAATDDRIGQISTLPGGNDIEGRLLASYHEKTRNAVRKGMAQGQTITRRDDPEALVWLQQVHEKSMLSLGAAPKPLPVLRHLLAEFPPGTGSRLYVGSLNGCEACGLLVLLEGSTVEYFTPVILEAYRDRQVLSHLIFHAMTELSRDGFRLWNWGGTARSQEGIYRFKKRWGAVDHPYRYFNRCDSTALRSAPRADLAKAFPWFYLFNYNSPTP